MTESPDSTMRAGQRHLAAITLLGLVCASTASLAGTTPSARRFAPADRNARAIASDVAIDGAWFAFGAHADRELGRAVGAVYVYRRAAGQWAQHAKLTPPDPAPRQHFGRALALDDRTLVVGAQLTETSDGVRSGAAHVFERSGTDWVHIARLAAPDGRQGDNFGAAVAVHDDRIAVAAPRADRTGRNSGAVHVFARTATGGWELDQIVAPTEGDDRFGFGSAIALDGRRMLVGATSAGNGGRAYLFRRGPAEWREVRRFEADGLGLLARFGRGVALHGRHLAIGAPLAQGPHGSLSSGIVRIFRRSGGEWRLDQELSAGVFGLEAFGWDLALQGRRLLVGAPDWANSIRLPGRAVLFRRGPAGWRETATHEFPQSAPAVGFGRHVDLDRGRSLLSAEGDRSDRARRKGAVWLFR